MSDSLKYEAVARALREELHGLEGNGRRVLPSERELTARFGVDRSTVRRALDLLEEEGLILRRPGRKTEVRHAARPARAGGRRHVAMVVNASPRGWATLPALHGAESVLTPAGYELTLYGTHAADAFQAERRERERLEFCLARGLSGVILWPAARGANVEPLRRLAAAGIPVVLLDHQLPEPELDFVGIDNVAAAYAVTAHLIQTGHRRIAHFSRANTMPTTLQRIEGYCRALEDFGLPSADEWLVRCLPGPNEKTALDALLEKPDPPSALFAINDMTALRLLQHLLHRGIRVPEQMAIASIDDLPVGELAAVPLSTVHQPWEEIGAEAARLLIERVEGRRQGPPETRLLPTRLVVRSSCGAGAVQRSAGAVQSELR